MGSIFRVCLKKFVVDKFMTEHGMIKMPALFAPIWFFLVMLGIVQGFILVTYRVIYAFLIGLLKSAVLYDPCTPKDLISSDVGYYAYLTFAYTQSARRNLLRSCFITLLLPQVQRVHWTREVLKDADAEGQQAVTTWFPVVKFSKRDGPGALGAIPSIDDTERKVPMPLQWRPFQETRRSRERRLRHRNKLWLCVTLWNNPELRNSRRRPAKQEIETIAALFLEENEVKTGKDLMRAIRRRSVGKNPELLGRMTRLTWTSRVSAVSSSYPASTPKSLVDVPQVS